MAKSISIIFLFLCLSFKSYTQSNYPFYEQIAFDFYKDEILKIFPVKTIIIVYKSLNYNADEELYYVPSDGLKSAVPRQRDSIKKIEFSEYLKGFSDTRLELNLLNIDNKQFKIKKSNKRQFSKNICSLSQNL